MKHARDDYSRIQDPENKIPEDEPVFLLRGQDRAAVPAIAAWIQEHERNGGDPQLTKLAHQQIARMDDWQADRKRKDADL